MYLCQNCGAELTVGVPKCRYCGAAAAAPQMPASVQTAPVAGGHPHPFPTGAVEQKSKIAAGILGILLGAFGIHNFYLGFTGKGLAQLLITVLTCGYGGLISGIWGLVEGIMILTGSIATDAKGVPLKD